MNISIKKIGALVLFMFSIFILSGCELLEPGTQDGGATPIYQGMTISDSMQNLSAQSSENKPSKLLLNKSYFFNAAFTIDDAIGDEFDFESNEELDYYSSVDTDLYITVNLNNPDGQAILRFTLNEVIYQSYQFQEGSDSEHLILKVNSGSTAGIKEFTIDEIKYVENVTNLTKDTLFEGDKTIQLGVTYNSIPTATVNNEVVNATSFSLDLVITDEEELISKSGNLLKALLYDGEEVVQSKDLTLSSTNVRFDKLNPNQEYEYAIATVVDSLDGNNNRIHILHSGEITTTNLLSIEDVVSTQDTITFGINVTDVDDVGSITAIELYKGETLVEALTDLSLRTFTNLLSNNEYQVKVTYTYDLNDGVGAQTLIITETATTLAKATPIVLIENVVPTQDSITFEINVTDVDEVGSITTIELYKGETLVEALTDLGLRTFTNLLSNNEYQVKVTYTYDLNDGVGSQTLIITETAATLAKATPVVLIENAVSTQDTITFEVNVTDVDEVGSITSIELYQGETLVESLTDLSLRTFTNLLSNNEYQVKVTYTYDLNDGDGEQTLVITKDSTTQAKATPVVLIENAVSAQDYITFNINITDVDEVGSITAIELYQGETLVESLTDLSLRTFTNLLSNNEYQVKVTYTYDLNDGAGKLFLGIEQTFTTLAKNVPALIIEEVVPTQDYITFNINITDVDEVGSITAIELYQGETLVKTLTDLSVREFTGLLSNNAYTIKVTYTYDLNDGVGAQTITINQAATTLAKATPTVVIDNVVPTQTSIGFGITVTDVDQVGAVSAIELYQGETLVEALTDLSVREFTGLLSNNEYTIKVTYTYDLNDGIGSQTLVVSQTATTVTKATPVVLLENVVPTQDTITFDINVTDVDEVGSITAIELYKGETLVEALTDLELRTFTNLLSNNEYQVKVTYTYDLDDGQNNQNSIEEYSFYTESKQLPKVEINDYLADNNELFIQPSIVDVDKVLVSVTYELYSEDNELIDSVVNPQESFKNIQSQTTYFLKIKINSDLNDNRGLYDEELIIQITIEYFGFGTEEKPYKIFTVDELIKTQNYFDKYFILVNDLDLSNMSWSPLSNLESHIDGQLHEIKGMKIMEMNESCAYGLFKQISTQGSIKNLIISEASINIQSMNSLTVGLLAAINMGIIEQVGVNGTINVSGTQIFGGGLVGTHGSFATNYIENSYASVDININPNSFTYLGGLTGFSGAPIRNSYSTGNIKVNNLVPADLFVGGLIGFHDTSEVLNCFSDVNLFIDKTAQYKDTRIGYFCGHTNTMHGIFNSYRITKQQLITDNNLYTATDLFIDSIDFSNISFDWLKETLLWSEENWVFNHIIEKSNKYPQLIDPMLDLTLIKIDNNCLTFTVYTSEAVMSGDLTFELYLDQTLISVLNNLNIVSIQNLLSNTKYNYIITYRFDLNDGVGEQAIIISDEVITKAKATPIVLIENVVSTQDTITFDINVTDVDEVGSITAIELYKGETLVEALTNLELRTFANLLSNNGYQIKVTYTYDLNDYVGSQTLTINQSTTTLAKATPTVVIDNVVPTQTSIGFGITVTDVDQVGAVSAIELYKGEILVETLTDLSAREFTGLLSNNEYTIKVLYTYNLNDGVGSQTLTISQTGTTVAKATPAVTIDNVVPTQSSIGFGITVTDVDQVGAVSAIELYKGETLIEALTDLSMREFTGLLSNNEYTIKVTYTYDLNDGYMDKELIIISNHRTFIEMISITDIEILNEFAPLLGEVINIELTLLNPSLQEISHVIINNVRYPISGGDKISKAYINYQPQNEVGIIEIEVSAIIYVIEQTEYTLYLAETISTNTTIFGDLDILSFELVDNQVYVLENESIILSFLISEKYNVKSIEINGNEITNFTQNLNGVISISLDAQSVGVYSFTINSITYGDEQYQTTKTINGISRKVYVVYSNIYISTFSELQNMEQGYAYTLTNDIDFDGQVWEPYDFYGVLNGNGYSIINMKLVKNTLNSSYGLFIYNYGYITRLSFPNVYYNINEQVGQSLGVVAAYNMSSGTIENIAVTGTIIVNSSSSNSNEVGGIVGYNMYGTINKVYFIGDVSGGSWWVGGIAGFNEGLVANSFSIYINPIPYPITITHFGQSINNYSISRDEEISMVTIMTKEFISGILLWDEQIWDMDNLSLLNNLLPLIRHN